MSNLSITVDGSARLSGRDQYIGWAVIAGFEGKRIERFGGYKLTNQMLQVASQPHEYIAFIEGIILAKELNIPFERVTMYSDDDTLGTANYWIHPGNYAPNRGVRLTRMSRILEAHYSLDLMPYVEDFFNKAFIIKVKGHRCAVEQERVDYLSNLASYNALNGSLEGVKSPAPYDFWIQQGFERWISPDLPPERTYPAFVASL